MDLPVKAANVESCYRGARKEQRHSQQIDVRHRGDEAPGQQDAAQDQQGNLRRGSTLELLGFPNADCFLQPCVVCTFIGEGSLLLLLLPELAKTALVGVEVLFEFVQLRIGDPLPVLHQIRDLPADLVCQVPLGLAQLGHLSCQVFFPKLQFAASTP